MTFRRIAASVGVIVALAASSPPALQEFPFEFKTRQPIVTVRVNGGAAVPFVVDTGATIHVVDRDILRESITANGRSALLSGGGQATVDVRFVEGLTFEVGGVSWSDQRAAVATLGYPDRKHFAGLLGAPILMRYTVQFAFPSQRMRLIDPATYTPPADAVLVPFELQEDLPIVHVSLDAGDGPIDARLMVDTGASAFIDLNRPFVDSHRLVEIIRDAKPLDRPAALGGTAPFLYGTARRATLGGLVFEGPRIGLSRAQSGSSSRHERDGILGNDLLRQFIVTVDYRRKTLVLERP
jgi:Aspartyl protease